MKTTNDLPSRATRIGAWAGVLLLSACAATTSVTVTPSAQAPVCQSGSEQLHAAVLWGTRWRTDQKDVAEREAAVAAGLARFFERSGCFARAELRRLASTAETDVQSALAAAAAAPPERTLVIVVRELGPVVKLFASAALVDGATEVVLEVSEYRAAAQPPLRTFTVRWHDGGPGMVKGVASLPADMEAALAAALQPKAHKP